MLLTIFISKRLLPIVSLNVRELVLNRAIEHSRKKIEFPLGSQNLDISKTVMALYTGEGSDIFCKKQFVVVF